MLAPVTDPRSCSDQPWLYSHDNSKAVPQEVRSGISLFAVLPSLEKGQDQNDEKLQGNKMRGSVGVFILGVAVVSALNDTWG